MVSTTRSQPTPEPTCHAATAEPAGLLVPPADRKEEAVQNLPNLNDPPAVDNRVFVLVLQHPQERREPRATATLAVASLRSARLVSGLSWPNLAAALGQPADPRRWGVVYLGSARPQAVLPGQEILVLDRAGVPVAEAASILARLEGIVLLDGTWSQAKTLWWRNPWLLKLHRLVLNPPRPARIGRLRREPRREALSTIEAASLVLRHLEAGPAAADALDAALGRLIAAQLPAQGAVKT